MKRPSLQKVLCDRPLVSSQCYKTFLLSMTLLSCKLGCWSLESFFRQICSTNPHQQPGNTKRRSITVPLTSCLTDLESTDKFCFYFQNRLSQTSQTGGQQYCDTSPFSIPCSNLTLEPGIVW